MCDFFIILILKEIMTNTQPVYSYFVYLSAVSPAISRCVFHFELLRVFSRFLRFFEILDIVHLYF